MRRSYLSFDAWICLLLSFVISLGVGKIAGSAAQSHYQKTVEEHAPVDGEIGGPAGDDVFRAQNVDDLISHDTFTVISPGIEFRNRGSGFYYDKYLQALTLPSGELVAAVINSDSIQQIGGDDYFSTEKILPLGRIVYEDLSKNKTFLEQIQHSEPLSRTDFYIDMVGDTAVLNEEQSVETPKLLAQLIAVALLFPLFHMIGSKLGIWTPYFRFKKREPSQWN